MKKIMFPIIAAIGTWLLFSSPASAFHAASAPHGIDAAHGTGLVTVGFKGHGFRHGFRRGYVGHGFRHGRFAYGHHGFFVHKRFHGDPVYGHVRSAVLRKKDVRRLLRSYGYRKFRGLHFQDGYFTLTAVQGPDAYRLKIDAVSGKILHRDAVS